MSLEEFIKTRLESVYDLRMLLLFHAAPREKMTASEVAGKLYMPPATSVEVLARLASKGLLQEEGSPARYRYHPESPEIAQLVDEIVELDRKQPVTLINLIYPQTRSIRAFSDAFKFRKDKEDKK